MSRYLWDYGLMVTVCQHCLSFGPCGPVPCLYAEPQPVLPIDEPIPESVPLTNSVIYLCPCCASRSSADGSLVIT